MYVFLDEKVMTQYDIVIEKSFDPSEIEIGSYIVFL